MFISGCDGDGAEWGSTETGTVYSTVSHSRGTIAQNKQIPYKYARVFGLPRIG